MKQLVSKEIPKLSAPYTCTIIGQHFHDIEFSTIPYNITYKSNYMKKGNRIIVVFGGLH